MRPTSLRGIQDGVGQGAVKHGRWNGYGAPDLCVMQVPPAYFHFYSMPGSIRHVCFDLFLYLRICICEADILLSQTWPYCYRMLTHSHSATSLYNWANLSQSEISLHQLFISRRHLNLRTSYIIYGWSDQWHTVYVQN
jgi:hypothetical protein